MSNQNIRPLAPIDLKTFDFQAHYRQCEQWNDADQWDALAMLYYQRGYEINALHCFKRADAIRFREMQVNFIGESPIATIKRVGVAVETEAG